MLNKIFKSEKVENQLRVVNGEWYRIFEGSESNKIRVDILANSRNYTDENKDIIEQIEELKGIEIIKSEFFVNGDRITHYITIKENNKNVEGENMENTKRIVLKGSDKVVTIEGIENTDFLGMKVLKALNENYILEEFEANGKVEIEPLYGNFEYYQVGNAEYRIADGEEEANELAIEYTKEVFEDCGISDNLLEIADQQGFINTDWFEDFWKELNENTAWCEGIEYIATDEQKEQLENGEITEDEIRENYEQSCNDSIGSGQEAMDEYKFQIGNEAFEEVVKKHELLDLDALAKYCVECDGRGHTLSSYDGEEIEGDNIFLYRTN